MAPEGESVPMPEVAVDEHGHLCTREDDIRLARKPAGMLTEAIASPVKAGAHHPLKPRILPLHPRHAVAALRATQVVHYDCVSVGSLRDVVQECLQSLIIRSASRQSLQELSPLSDGSLEKHGPVLRIHLILPH